MKTIKQGSKVAKIDFGKFSVDELITVLEKRKNKIVAKNTSEYIYKKLQRVYESEDKKIVFEFSNNASLYFNLPDYKFYHSKDNKLVAKSKPALILNPRGRTIENILLYGDYRLDAFSLCESNWIKTFFAILSEVASLNYWIHNSQLHKSSKKILFCEHLAKQEYIQKFILESVDRDPNYVNKFWYIASANTRDVKRNVKIFNEKYEWYFKNAYKTSINLGTDTLIDEIGYNSFEHAHKSKLGDVFAYAFDNYQIILTPFYVDNVEKLANFGYDSKRLIDYIFRDLRAQGIDILSAVDEYGDSYEDDGTIVQTLVDYARMNEEMKREYEKYPRYLKSFHDITVQNYNLFKRKTTNKKFQKVVNNFAKYEYQNESYCVIAPSFANDLITEGVRLNHCVASYIDDVIEQKTCIMFLRKNLQKEMPLVTLEIKNNKIVQAKGKNNGNPGSDESKFLLEYKNHLNYINEKAKR